LRENVQLNDLQQVGVIPRGVWDEPTTTTLYEFDENRLDLPSMGDWSDSTVARRVEVETTRIDDAVEGPIRMMKVDVEGAEYRALQGAERTIFGSGASHLILELCPESAHSFGYEAIELADWVLEREPNYRMYWIKSRRCVPIDREGICAVLERDPGKYRNIWFRPPG